MLKKMEIRKDNWIHLISILVLATHQAMPLQAFDNCESPWERVQRSCVCLVNSGVTWQNARDKCMEYEANLVIIKSVAKANQLQFLLRQRTFQLEKPINWWIGLQYVDNVWMWVDEGVLDTSVIKWAPGHPLMNGSHIGDCATMNYQGFMKSDNCQKNNSYICERSAAITSLPPLSSTVPSKRTTKATQVPDFPTDTLPALTQTTSRFRNLSATSEVTMTTSDQLEIEKSTDKATTKNPENPTSMPDEISTTISIYVNVTESAVKNRPTVDKFKGCYSVNYEIACPSMQAFGVIWPRTEAGRTASVNCSKGRATWKCDKDLICWRDEPNLERCTSESIRTLVDQLELFKNDSGNSEKATMFLENLAATVLAESAMSTQDLFQVTKLLWEVTLAKPQNISDAKKILQNVIKCGSSLISNNKSSTWSAMTAESRRTIASSLLNSIEAVTTEMVKAYTKPTIQTLQEDNMVVQLNVVDVSALNTTTQDITFQGESTSFSIPPENVKKFSFDGLARIVFINYFNVAEMLKPAKDNSSERKVISNVFSASIGDRKGNNLSEPVTFTFKVNRSDDGYVQQHCAFWDFNLGYNGAWSYSGCTLQNYNATHTTCQCSHLTNFAILMNMHNTKATNVNATTLSYITYVGIIISAICLFLSWISFVCLSSTQGERNSIHKHLVFCLFISEILFIAGIDKTNNKIACAVIAGFLHYFFLGSFMWMFLEGIHILLMLVQVFDVAVSRLKYYYMIGYGCPLIIVAVSALVYYEGYGTEQYCWLTTEQMFIWSFAGPVAFIIVVNLIILAYAISAVCRHSEYVFTKEKSILGNFRAWIQGALAMEVLLGLTWVFGYFYISEDAIPLAYLFTIFNSLQGFFIFLFYCLLNKKVRKEYRMLIDHRKRPVSKESNNTSKSGKSSEPKTCTPHTTTTSQNQQEAFDLNTSERRPSAKFSTSA